MDLQELYRAIPKDRQLCLSHDERGIIFRIVDRSTVGRAKVGQMISGTELLRAGLSVEQLFFDRLRTMNATLDRMLLTGEYDG